MLIFYVNIELKMIGTSDKYSLDCAEFHTLNFNTISLQLFNKRGIKFKLSYSPPSEFNKNHIRQRFAGLPNNDYNF